MATLAVALLLQPLVGVTVALRLTLPDPVAVKLIAFVPWPLLIVPFVIVHTLPGALMIGAGGAVMGTVALEFALQPPFATVSDNVTLPLAPAVNVIPFVPAPAVIVPLAIDHV